MITESKVLAGKTRRALDSTVLDDAVARQDTITLLVTQIRRVRKLVGDADAAPGLLADEPAGTEVLGDSAYSAGEFRAHLQDRDMPATPRNGRGLIGSTCTRALK